MTHQVQKISYSRLIPDFDSHYMHNPYIHDNNISRAQEI